MKLSWNNCIVPDGSHRQMYKLLNKFRLNVARTGVVTPAVERAFLAAYPEYEPHKDELHGFSLLCNVRGWLDTPAQYSMAERLDMASPHPLLIGIDSYTVDEVTRHWNTPSFVPKQAVSAWV